MTKDTDGLTLDGLLFPPKIDLATVSEVEDDPYEFEKEGGVNQATKCKKKLKATGLDAEWEVVVSDQYHLQVDCDSEADYQFCMEQLKVLQQYVSTEQIRVTKSKSGNRHVIIKTKAPFDQWQRVAMQAALGSDRMREMLSICSILKGDIHPILLIEAKDEFREEEEIGLDEL